MRTVGEAMTREVLTVHPDTPFKQLAELLVEHRIDGLPVVDERGTLQGVVSGSDLTCHEESAPSLVEFVRHARTARTHAKKARGRTARELMTAPARTVPPEAGICDALALMGRAKVGRLVVVQDGRVIGMLTRSDVLRVFTRNDEQLAREVEDRVRQALAGVRSKVHVAVADGVVHLRGDVERASSACAAAAAAAGVVGVVDVEDDLHAEVDDLTELAGVPGA
jgi:CBS domain-containing protein